MHARRRAGRSGLATDQLGPILIYAHPFGARTAFIVGMTPHWSAALGPCDRRRQRLFRLRRRHLDLWLQRVLDIVWRSR